MNKILIIILISVPFFQANAQIEITWKTLQDVRWTDKFSEEVNAYFYYPDFGQSVQDLEGKLVSLKGFLLVLDPAEDFYMLSQNPFASCFFCGQAGPESVVELRFKPGQGKLKMDQVITVQGRLRLNKENVYECNYIFEEAEILQYE